MVVKKSQFHFISLIFLFTLNYLVTIYSCNSSNQSSAKNFISNDSIEVVENPEWFYFGFSYERLIERNGTHEKGIKIGKWNYLLDKKKETSIFWEPYKIKNITWCLPNTWVNKSSEKYFFLADIQDFTDSYFVILEHPNEYSPLEYVSNFYNYSLEDEKERLVSASAKAIETPDSKTQKIIYNFRFSYKGEFWSALGLTFLHEDHLYDVVLKIQEKENIIPYWEREVFTDIINCLKINGKPVIPSMEKIVDIVDVTFEE